MDKETLRRKILELRRAESNRDEKSQRVLERLFQLTEFKSAQNIAYYINVGSEVRTRPFLLRAIEGGKRVYAPYCQEEDLAFCEVKTLSDLAPGCLGVLEPNLELRKKKENKIEIQNLKIVLVPGVAFDQKGGRLGRGRGYYDRLLSQLSPTTTSIALAFECQVVDIVPMGENDIYVDKLITEQTVYDCRLCRDNEPEVA